MMILFRNPSFLVVRSALLHLLCLFPLHYFWCFAKTTYVFMPISYCIYWLRKNLRNTIDSTTYKFFCSKLVLYYFYRNILRHVLARPFCRFGDEEIILY